MTGFKSRAMWEKQRGWSRWCCRQITCCNSGIHSVMFLHREDMQPLDTHGKEGVDMIVPMDTVECERAGSANTIESMTCGQIR